MSDQDHTSDSAGQNAADNSADWRVDTFRNYEVRGLIGRGGAATVVEGLDISLRRSLAIKQIRPELSEERDSIDRFVSEARIMASLEHPGVVPVHELGLSEDNNHYYTMKKVSGMTLQEMLNARSSDLRSSKMLTALLEVFERICQTVAYAHTQGVIHRDIKPDNIMVDDFDMVYLMDWGIAKKIGDGGPAGPQFLTHAGAIVGTPAYLSPEQAAGRGAEADYRTDVFLLGIVLYEILTGKRPFDAESLEKLLDEVVSDKQPQPPSGLNPLVDKFMSAVCMKALEKDPDRRYQDAGELAADIQNHRRYLPVSALQPKLCDKFTGWIRRRPALAAGFGVASFVLAVLVSIGGYRAYIYNSLLEEGRSRLGELRAEVVLYENKVEAAEERIAAVVAGGQRVELELKREELESRLEVVRMEVTQLLVAMLGFTIYNPDPRVVAEVRGEIFDSIAAAFESGRFVYAKVLVENALENARRENYIPLGPEDIERLRRYRERAERRIEEYQVQKKK